MTREDLWEELWEGVRQHQEADHELVNKIIFWNAAVNEYRGYFDVFMPHEIQKLASLDYVWKHWPKHERNHLAEALRATYENSNTH